MPLADDILRKRPWRVVPTVGRIRCFADYERAWSAAKKLANETGADVVIQRLSGPWCAEDVTRAHPPWKRDNDLRRDAR